MKKILIIFLGIFSLLIINEGYCSIKQGEKNCFTDIENQILNESKFDENGIKLEYYTNLSEIEEKDRINNLILNKFGVDGVNKGNNINIKIKEIDLSTKIYSIDIKTKVEIIILNKDGNVDIQDLLNIAEEIRGNKYTGTRIFQFIKCKVDYIEENVPKCVVENSKQDTIRSLEINNGRVSNIVMNDDENINVAQVNYNSGSYLVIGTPTIFITY